jgi:hypothetical protein
MAFYNAGRELAESYGLGWGMKWPDTNQTALHIRLNRGECRHQIKFYPDLP